MSGRFWSRVLVAALGVALVSGCGGAPAGPQAPAAVPPPADQVVRDSYGKLVGAGSARLESEATFEVRGQRAAVQGDGELDFGHQAYALTLSGSGLENPKVVGMNGIAYLQFPQVTSQIPGSKPWLLVDPVKLRDNPAAQQIAGATNNPFAELSLVQGAGPDTRGIGPDTVDGEQVTHYATTIDFARARQNVSDPSTRTALDQYAGKVGAPSMPGEVWIDGQGRLRKLVLTVPAAAGHPAVATTETFTALGAPVPSVVAPPPDQVTDLAEAISRGGG